MIYCVARWHERSAQQESGAAAQLSYHPGDRADNTHVTVVGNRGNDRLQEREMDCFQPMLAGTEVSNT